jgi:transposase
LDILSAYNELGSFRAAAALCGTTHKTVRRVVERRNVTPAERPPRPKSTDALAALIAERVRATDGRISAKRLMTSCQAAGYSGSPRHLRRAVAEAKVTGRHQRRVYRPWAPVPGEHLAIDWGQEGKLHVFCAVLAWSRVRFVRFAEREDQATTLRFLAECFEVLGGVPAVVLADRMGCLKGGVVANVVVPAPGHVAFAAHYGFRPDFCEAADPESKGIVENLVGYAKSDLVIPAGGWQTIEAANEDARLWCAEVNGRIHSEIAAVPDVRLAAERNVLRSLPSLRPAVAPNAVLIDELGFAPLDDTGSQLLFRFVAAAYERRSLGIASHWPFEEWGRFLPEHSTAVALLDRLLHHSVTVVTSGDSFRMREARTRGGGPPPTP